MIPHGKAMLSDDKDVHLAKPDKDGRWPNKQNPWIRGTFCKENHPGVALDYFLEKVSCYECKVFARASGIRPGIDVRVLTWDTDPDSIEF